MSRFEPHIDLQVKHIYSNIFIEIICRERGRGRGSRKRKNKNRNGGRRGGVEIYDEGEEEVEDEDYPETINVDGCKVSFL